MRLKALDYFTPDVSQEPANLKHVRFSGVQVVMMTLVVVVAEQPPVVAGETAAFLYDMGRDSWLRSFATHHLDSCSHYKLVFYDEVFDVIASSLECRMGAFSESSEG